jgi:hypothetical protein
MPVIRCLCTFNSPGQCGVVFNFEVLKGLLNRNGKCRWSVFYYYGLTTLFMRFPGRAVASVSEGFVK